MTVSLFPLYVQDGKYKAGEERIGVFNSIFDTPGRVRKDQLVVSAMSNPTMQVRITAGSAVIAPPTTTYTTGFYVATSTEQVDLTIAGADPANPRIDRIVLQVIDSELSIGSTSACSFSIITGTPATTPIAPEEPSMSLTLATIRVDVNTTSITEDKVDSSMSPVATLSHDGGGGLHVISSDAELATLIQVCKDFNTISATSPLIYLDTRSGQLNQTTTGTDVKSLAGANFTFGSSKTTATSFSTEKGHVPLIQSGTYVGKTTSGGDIVIPFPRSFPNGLSTCVVMLGDAGVAGRYVVNIPSKTSLVNYGIRVYNASGSVVKNALQRFEYIAIGW